MPQKERKYLTPSEFQTVYDGLKTAFTSTLIRNRAMLLLMYRHGLRASETLNLKWSNISKEDQNILIERLKNGKSGVHPIAADELQALNRLRNDYKSKKISSTFIFLNYSNGIPLTRRAITQIFDYINKANLIDIYITPHTLRHSCGYYLANEGHSIRLIQDYLGHRNIQNTEIYTELSAKKFEAIRWK